jgi:hypothetical protein
MSCRPIVTISIKILKSFFQTIFSTSTTNLKMHLKIEEHGVGFNPPFILFDKNKKYISFTHTSVTSIKINGS